MCEIKRRVCRCTWCSITLMTINEKVSDGEKVMSNGAYAILASLLLLIKQIY